MSIYETIDLYKKEIDKLRPFEGKMLEQIKAYYKIGLTWSSNALEGNTYTESETKVLLEDGLTVGGKPLKDTFDKKFVEFIAERVKESQKEIMKLLHVEIPKLI